MRKNLLFRILLIAVPFAMLFSSCNKKDDMSIDEPQKVDLVFQANLTKPMLKGANLPYDEMLAALKCHFDDYGTIHVKIATEADYNTFLNGGDFPKDIEEGDIPGDDYYLGYTGVGEGVASDLVQLAPGNYYLTLFQVGNGGENDFIPRLATPMIGSSFNDFVTKPLPEPFTVGDYDKTRVLLDVLCFNQQLAPAFGFYWFDYNIVRGDEICVFVNCINEYDRIYYHQVFASDIYAWKTTLDGEEVVPAGDTPYWEVGPNYELVPTEVGDGSEVVGSVEPMCFPLYDVLEDMDHGVILQLKPVFGKNSAAELIYGDDVLVHIPLEIIEQYLGLIPLPEEPNDGVPGGAGVTVKVENVEGSGADNPRYIHIMLTDCHKPAYFESHNDDNGAHEIYALRFDYPNPGEVDMTKILDLTQTDPTMTDPHIAVAPNRRQLYIVDSEHSDKILVYDLYSMSHKTFDVYQEVNPDKITQLVFMDGTLFAADMNNNVLGLYVLEPNGETYKLENYKEFSYPDPTIIDFSGGDLIATDAGTLWSFSKNSSSAYVHEIDIATGTVTKLATEDNMYSVFGSMVYEDNATIITGDGGATGLESWSWTWNGTPLPVSFTQGVTYTPVPAFTYLYGDLASPFILNRPAQPE